jgi:sugar-specific transcriptional regulator TrmB
LSENCEKTEVIYGIDNIIKRAIEGLSRIRKTEGSVFASNGLSAFLPIGILKNQYQLLKERGAKIRFITDITKEDIPYCKEAMKFAELRHLDEIKGNFGVHDRVEYTATATLEKAGSPTQRLIYSNVKEIVEQHQYLFETLWNKAILAEQKIGELECGIVPYFIETIRDSEEIQRVAIRLLNSAKEEILLILPSANTFHRQEHTGIIQLLEQLSTSKSTLHIKIMTPADYRIKDVVKRLEEQYSHQNIQIQYI